MIKSFIILAVSLVALFGAVAAHFITYNKSSYKKAALNIVSITKIAKPSFATSTKGPIVHSSKIKVGNSIYPELPKIDFLDYIYVR